MKYKLGDLLRYRHMSGKYYYAIIISIMPQSYTEVFWINSDRNDGNTSYIHEMDIFEVISK